MIRPRYPCVLRRCAGSTDHERGEVNRVGRRCLVVGSFAPDNDSGCWDVTVDQGSLFHVFRSGVTLAPVPGGRPDALVVP